MARIAPHKMLNSKENKAIAANNEQIAMFTILLLTTPSSILKHILCTDLTEVRKVVKFPACVRFNLPGGRTPPCAIACIHICVHVKGPVIHVGIRWITEAQCLETLHPALYRLIKKCCF